MSNSSSMFYTLMVFLFWLVLGAPRFELDFNPVLMAFVVALVVDLYINRVLLPRRENA